LDRVISIESGIFLENCIWIDRAVVLYQRVGSGDEDIRYSEGVIFPEKYVAMARKEGFDSITVGSVMKRENFIENYSDPHLSISGRSREEYIKKVVLDIVRSNEDC